MTAYEIVHGPHDIGSPVDRALIANVSMARECALTRDSKGEAIHHQAINQLLELRGQGDDGRGGAR